MPTRNPTRPLTITWVRCNASGKTEVRYHRSKPSIPCSLPSARTPRRELDSCEEAVTYDAAPASGLTTRHLLPVHLGCDGQRRVRVGVVEGPRRGTIRVRQARVDEGRAVNARRWLFQQERV